MNEIAIIIVSWNSSRYIEKCLESINKYYPDCEVIVVDNASSDDSVKVVKKFRKVKLIINKTNIGFGRACNLAVSFAKKETLFFLNPDTEIEANSLELLFKKLIADESFGAVSPSLVDPKSHKIQSSYYRKYPNLLQVTFFYTDLERFFHKSNFFKRVFLEENLEREKHLIDQLPGAALMIKKRIFNSLGGFDKNLFLWFEDVDLSFRLKKMGYELILVREAFVRHYGGKSFEKWEDIWEKRALMQRSLRYFVKKNYSTLSYNLINLVLNVDELYLWIKKRLRHRL